MSSVKKPIVKTTDSALVFAKWVFTDLRPWQGYQILDSYHLI